MVIFSHKLNPISMASRISVWLFTTFILIPFVGQAQEFSIVKDDSSATIDGLYLFKIYDLPDLEQLEPIEEFGTARYELLIEVGDGYYTRKTMPNPRIGTDTFRFYHQFGPRTPLSSSVSVLATPIYSPNRRPTRLDNAISINPIIYDFNSTWSTSKDGLIPGAVKADLSWHTLEAEDEFTVIAGYTFPKQPPVSAGNFNFNNGGYLSIYYNRDIVEPVEDEGDVVFRSYLENVVDPQNIPIESDLVYNEYEELGINAHMDFRLDTGVFMEEFIYATFQMHDAEMIGETSEFPIVVVLRDRASGEPSSQYIAESVKGELRYGKDPNTITGLPRPICLPDSSLDSLLYHVEFFNSGTAIVDSVQFKITLPDHVDLANPPNFDLLEARFGSPDQLDLVESDISIEVVPPNQVIVTVKGAKVRVEYGNPPAVYFQSQYLNGYQEKSSEYRSSYYPYCSAEFLFRFVRNKAIDDCEKSGPIEAVLEVGFPSGEVLARRDTILCECEEEVSTCPGFCNIFPSIPFLGGCCCTPLLILLIIIVGSLIFLIWRNMRQQS